MLRSAPRTCVLATPTPYWPKFPAQTKSLASNQVMKSKYPRPTRSLSSSDCPGPLSPQQTHLNLLLLLLPFGDLDSATLVNVFQCPLLVLDLVHHMFSLLPEPVHPRIRLLRAQLGPLISCLVQSPHVYRLRASTLRDIRLLNVVEDKWRLCRLWSHAMALNRGRGRARSWGWCRGSGRRRGRC